MKNIIYLLLGFFILFNNAYSLETSAKQAYLIDVLSQKVLLEKNKE